MKNYNNYILENNISESDAKLITINRFINLFKSDKLNEIIKNSDFTEEESNVILHRIIDNFSNLDYDYDLVNSSTIKKLIENIKDKYILIKLLKESIVLNRGIIAYYLIEAGADVNFKDNTQPFIFLTLFHNSIKVLKVMLDADNIKTNIIYEDNTLLTFAAQKFYNYNEIFPLLDADIDWNHTIELHGKVKTFIEMLDSITVKEIKKNFPEKYKEYLMHKDLEKFNI